MSLATALDILEINGFQTVPAVHTRPICPHILIVEDEPISQKIMQYFVKHAGYTCDAVEKGEDGVELMKVNRYGLIFMDIGLPGDIDGTEATRRIRQYEMENNRTPLPIIAISAHLLTQDYPKVYEAGANVVLGKPTELSVIRRLLRQYVPLADN